MKLRYLIYNVKCHITRQLPVDYIDWLMSELFIHKQKKGEEYHA